MKTENSYHLEGVGTLASFPPEVNFRYLSRSGWSGCTGLVRLGELSSGDQSLRIQVKHFYEQSVDDRGDSFSQNPSEEVERSFKTFQRLKNEGFKLIPDFGVLTDPKGDKLLALTDLTFGGERIVYDDKDRHQNRLVIHRFKGKQIRKKAHDAISQLSNTNEVSLTFLHTNILQFAHGVSFGYPGGVEHMTSVDPLTNRGEAWVVDVGDVSYNRADIYRECVDPQALLLPQTEIESLYAKLLETFHPSESASSLYQDYLDQNPTKALFQEAFTKAALRKGIDNQIGGIHGDAAFAKVRFIRNRLPDHFLRIKYILSKWEEGYQRYTGSSLLDISSESVARFKKGQSAEDLQVGVDIATKALLDSRLSYLIKARLYHDSQLPVPVFENKITIQAGIPRMKFFDNFDESKGSRGVFTVFGYSLSRWGQPKLEVDLDWEQGYHSLTNMYPRLFFLPNQVQSFTIDGQKIPGDQLAVCSSYPNIDLGDHYYLTYKREIVAAVDILDADGLTELKEYLSERSGS